MFDDCAMLYKGLSILFYYLFSGLFQCLMKDFHLLREVFFKPGILFYLVSDELDCHCSGDFNGSFTFLATIEPCLSPPSDTALVGIDADKSGNIEALYVDVQFRKRIDKAAAGYGSLFSFFFSSTDIEERNI